MNLRRKSGVTLIELLVSLTLVSIIFLLLFRGMQVIGDGISQGRRQQEIDRTLRTAIRVIQEDLQHLLVGPAPLRTALDWDHLETRHTFSRLRLGASPDLDHETVVYRIVPHPDHAGIEQLWRDRYPGMPDPLPGQPAASELLIPWLLGMTLRVLPENDSFSLEVSEWTQPPELLELTLGLTAPPLGIPGPLEGGLFTRAQQTQGRVEVLRIRPLVRWSPE